MRTRLFSELATCNAPSAPTTLPNPADIAYLLIEANHINVILHCHNAHGALMHDAIHPTIDAARQDAAKRFGDRVGAWQPVPFEQFSIIDILGERRRQLIAAGHPIDLTLSYFRPRKRVPGSEYWWRGLAWHSGMQAALLVTFGFVFLGGSPLAYFLLRGFLNQRGLMSMLIDIVLLCLLVSRFLWTFPRIYGTLTGFAIVVMGFALMIILTVGMRDATAGPRVIAYATAAPFIVFALWRCMHLATRWVDEE